MISYKQSIEILKKSKIFIKNETVITDNCLNRVLANSIKSNVNNPSADNSAFPQAARQTGSGQNPVAA